MADQQTPQNTSPLPAQAAAEIGASGTYFFEGYITAEEYSIDLQGKYGLQVYDVMRKSDATVRAALKICKDPILGADWQLDPASADEKDIAIAERANREFFKRKFNYYDTMREGLSFLDFGFYTGELVFEPTSDQDGLYIGLAKIGFRKQRSVLKWQLSNGKPGIVQVIPSGGFAEIPREKLLVVVNDREGENYFGNSLLRYAYKPWKIKDGLEIMNAVALEKMAMGIPYIKKGVNNLTVDENELKNARQIIRQQRANEEAFFEYGAALEVGFTDMKSQTTKDVIPTIEYQDRQILLSVLGQFLLLGQQDSGGSRAVSADHSRLFVRALDALAKQWQEAFQRDVIDKWAALNYSDLPNGSPKLTYSPLSDEDVQETANAVAALVTAQAITPDTGIENRLRKMLNLPEIDVSQDAYDEDLVGDEPGEGAGSTNDNAVEEVAEGAKTQKTNPAQAQSAGNPNRRKQLALANAKRAQHRLLDALR